MRTDPRRAAAAGRAHAAQRRRTQRHGMLLAACALVATAPALASVNSYRFLHVTIDTPWHILLFLLMGIFAPFILMVVLMWRNSNRKRDLARDAVRGKSAAAPASPQPPQS